MGKIEQLGRYKIIESIAKGGMGEVFLAYDPECERRVALKVILERLKEKPLSRERFLREAKITAGLTHPGVISIYSIHEEADELYYTMPYVEGETLKQILGKEEEMPIGALMPIFSSVCQTVAYAHSKGIIHRDLKPENILVGKYGEVIILDWGLAQLESEAEIEEKLSGTAAFLAPERLLGTPASKQSDLYALGVILYQMLTLHHPFNRPSIKEFRKNREREKFVEPEELAPYREVPPRLASIARKCLEANPEDRYETMETMLHDLMAHMEGRSEWFQMAILSVDKRDDWQFQENVMMAKHMALTRTTEAAEWVNVMLSQAAFAENTRLETRVHIGEEGAGIGFLLSVPEAAEREDPIEGYLLWIGSENAPGAHLFRNTVEVMHDPELFLQPKRWHTLAIEKIDNNIHFSLDGTRRFTYISYLPLVGTHVGMLARDADYRIEPIEVSVGSQNLQVSCLSIPDAFLASKDYTRALAEYRRIGYSFPGHAEGREALFRAGVTLLEEAKNSKSAKKADALYSAALEEFSSLHNSPGAPLEYLGKALVYQGLRDTPEEIKCIELGLRRYKKHPLVGALKEQLIYRMHESSQRDRRAAYQLILIALRQLPDVVQTSDSQRLFRHLVNHWEPLPFLEGAPDPSLIGKEKATTLQFAIPLAFWLGNPYPFLELFSEVDEKSAQGDILYALIELGSFGLAQKLSEGTFPEFDPLFLCHTESLEKGIEAFLKTDRTSFRVLSYLLQFALRSDKEEMVHEITEKVFDLPLARQERILLDAYRVWAYLLQNKWSEAGEIFENYPLELLNQESTLLHPLYGCYLQVIEGEEIAQIHFAGVIDTPFPRSWALLGHELTNKISEAPQWYNTSFLFERRALYRQLTLFYACSDNAEMEAYYRHLEKQEYVYFAE